MLNPTLSCHFPTNDCMLCYSCIPHPVFGNTMFAGTESKNGNKCCQVFSTNFGWARVHPLKQKGEAHEALLLMFKHDSILPKMILDSSKGVSWKSWIVICAWQSHINPGSRQPRAAFASSSAGFHAKWSELVPQNAIETTALNWRAWFALTPPMTSMPQAGRSQKPSWKGGLLTSVKFVSLLGMTGSHSVIQ